MYKASIDDDDPDMLITAETIKASSFMDIKEEQMMQCVKDKCVSEMSAEQLFLLHDVVKNVHMKMNTEDAEDRI